MNVSSWKQPRSQGPLLLGEIELETEWLFKVKMLNLSFIKQFLCCSGASKICKKGKYIIHYLFLSVFPFQLSRFHQCTERDIKYTFLKNRNVRQTKALMPS